MMSYAEKLANPLWQKRRLQVFEKDGWKCTACHATTRQLEVHHVDYIPGINTWDYPDDMLKTLCHECHDKENGRVTMESGLSTALKFKGFLFDDLKALETMLYSHEGFTNNLKAAINKFKGV